MTAWLKLIGSAKKPITAPPFNGNYTQEHVGFRKANKPSIQAGDRLFLYASGGSKSIFALAEAAGNPERDPNYNPNEEGSCYWRLPVRYRVNLPVASGILIGDLTSQRVLTRSIGQASHIRLAPEESESAHRKLHEKAKQ
jgi:hypothetical protein